MHRRSVAARRQAQSAKEKALTLRIVLWALLAAASVVFAQDADTRRPEPKAEKKGDQRPDEKAKPRPRVILKKDGNVGDDAAGGRGGGASSLGGTPGTPSGSFTR
jgi:hypothetical protein